MSVEFLKQPSVIDVNILRGIFYRLNLHFQKLLCGKKCVKTKQNYSHKSIFEEQLKS